MSSTSAKEAEQYHPPKRPQGIRPLTPGNVLRRIALRDPRFNLNVTGAETQLDHASAGLPRKRA